MKHREPRHSVAVSARLRSGTGWADATILNLSNRGLMFRCTQKLERGHFLELRRGQHVIVARVVWSDEGCFGAQAQGILPVADIVNDMPVRKGLFGRGERRAQKRPPERIADASRQRGRAIEFFLAGVGAASVAFLIADIAFGVIERPLSQVELALDGHPR